MGQGVVVALCSEPENRGDTHSVVQVIVYVSFAFELGYLRLNVLELYGNFLLREDIRSTVDSSYCKVQQKLG